MGCAQAAPAVSASVSRTPEFATATLPPTAAPSVTSTAGAAAPTNAPAPVIGTTTTQLNVRVEPQASAASLGIIPAAGTVQIIGKAPGENWYEVLYEGGTGWVASQYVSVADKVPVPMAGWNGAAPMASVREQIFVRTGPGTGFETVGTQSARDVVQLVGRDVAGTWLQIEFADGPDGRGWVAASFLEAAQMDLLPIVAESGEVLGTATPTGTVPASTPTVAAAREDDDSAESPIVDIAFSPSGTGSVLYEGEVSAPDGDMDDWVRFRLYKSDVAFRIECSGNSTLSLQLLRDGRVVESGELPACGQQILMNLEPGAAPYTLLISAVPVEDTLVLIRYRLRIANFP
jgi:N-acetylmuramoyl-L-alanine amidase